MSEALGQVQEARPRLFRPYPEYRDPVSAGWAGFRRTGT